MYIQSFKGTITFNTWTNTNQKSNITRLKYDINIDLEI